MFDTQPDDLEAEISKAKKKLADFESGASWRELTARLQASSPMSPFLLARSLGLVGAGATTLVMLVVVVGSVFSRDVAEIVNGVEEAILVPVPVVLAGLTAMLGVGALLGWMGAVSAGRDAPYLPHEAKVHQRLMSEVQQLEAKRHVKERMTPKPATPRLLDRRGR
jgi:hypothetical protein